MAAQQLAHRPTIDESDFAGFDTCVELAEHLIAEHQEVGPTLPVSDALLVALHLAHHYEVTP